MIFTDDEAVKASMEVAHYGQYEIEGAVPSWKITDADGQLIEEGEFGEMDIHWGHNQQIGVIDVQIKVESASKFQLALDVAGFINTWDFWVYPSELEDVKENILVVSSFNEKARATLNQGGNVLLSVKKGSIREGKGGEVAVGFSSIFWNTAWTNGQKPHTLGILCDPDHPALSEFPTEYHSNWQWWDAMSHSNAICLEEFENEPEPIVRIIDDWVTNRNLALIFEAKVGNGKLLFSGIDLQSDLENRPEARQLLYSLSRYMHGEQFDPEIQIKKEEIMALFN